MVWARGRRSGGPASGQAARTRPSPQADDVIATLRAHEAELRAAGIKHVSLFGSIARGDAGPDSDVRSGRRTGPGRRASHLIRLVGLEREIGELLGRTVDLLPEPIEKARLVGPISNGDRKHAFYHDPVDCLADINNAARIAGYIQGMDQRAFEQNGS